MATAGPQEVQQPQQTPEQIWADMDNADAGTKPAVTDTVATEKAEQFVVDKEGEPAKAAPAEDDKPAVDPLDVVKQHLSKLTEQASATATQLSGIGRMETALREMGGRVASFQSELAKAGQAAAKAVKDAPSAVQITEAVEDPEEWKQLQADFPEWARGMDKRIQARIAQIKLPAADLTPLQTQLAESNAKIEAFNARFETQAKEMESMRATFVEIHHPGWQGEVKTPAFKAWYTVQPPEIRALGGSENPLDAIKVMTLFKNRPDPAKIAASRTEKLVAATEVKGTGSAPKGKAFAEMSADEQWKEMDRQAKARGETY